MRGEEKGNNGSNKEFQRTERYGEGRKQRSNESVGGVTVAIERSIVGIGHSVAKSVGSWRKREVDKRGTGRVQSYDLTFLQVSLHTTQHHSHSIVDHPLTLLL